MKRIEQAKNVRKEMVLKFFRETFAKKIVYREF